MKHLPNINGKIFVSPSNSTSNLDVPNKIVFMYEMIWFNVSLDEEIRRQKLMKNRRGTKLSQEKEWMNWTTTTNNDTNEKAV